MYIFSYSYSISENMREEIVLGVEIVLGEDILGKNSSFLKYAYDAMINNNLLI
jgi:hypothetical protein